MNLACGTARYRCPGSPPPPRSPHWPGPVHRRAGLPGRAAFVENPLLGLLVGLGCRSRSAAIRDDPPDGSASRLRPVAARRAGSGRGAVRGHLPLPGVATRTRRAGPGRRSGTGETSGRLGEDDAGGAAASGWSSRTASRPRRATGSPRPPGRDRPRYHQELAGTEPGRRVRLPGRRATRPPAEPAAGVMTSRRRRNSTSILLGHDRCTRWPQG